MILFIVPLLLVFGIFYFVFSRYPLSYHPAGKRIRKPIGDVMKSGEAITYGMKDLHAPRTSGLLFKLLIRIAYSRFGRIVLVPHMLKGSGLYMLDGLHIPETPTFVPMVDQKPTMVEEHSSVSEELDRLMEGSQKKRSSSGESCVTVADYIEGYRSGKFTPIEVVTATLKCVEQLDPTLKSISQLDQQSVMKMASSSSQRWKEGKPLSLIDGVPVVIKEMLLVEPHNTYCGCSFVPVAARDIRECTVALKLKEAGAVMLGVTNMQEMGFGTLGSNPNAMHGTARNPYNTDYYAGGSSTGSAVAVAAGFCPISVGCDGGGSIRIPSSLCGIVGLKPTFARVSGYGCTPLAFTMCDTGPMCACVTDTAILHSIISGPDSNFTDGIQQPPLTLSKVSEMDLSGITIGVYNEWFDDADTSVILACRKSLKGLEELGATVVNIKIPELEEIRIAHLLTIFSEMSASMFEDIEDHFNELNLETLLPFVCGTALSGTQYVTAQKQRTRAINCLKIIFKTVDCIVTPATACVAPKIPPDALSHGESDLTTSGRLMKYASLGNFTGIPGIVLPVGYDGEGLPIGLQVMGRWWEEHVLLRVARAIESCTEWQPPTVHCNPLSKLQ